MITMTQDCTYVYNSIVWMPQGIQYTNHSQPPDLFLLSSQHLILSQVPTYLL